MRDNGKWVAMLEILRSSDWENTCPAQESQNERTPVRVTGRGQNPKENDGHTHRESTREQQFV